jgi:dCTP deaminase
MAAEHGLIEPFEPGRCGRTVEGPPKIVSYGTSSYGYDVRCAREFKIFTNINSTIVDPKQFDEKSFVDGRPTCASFRPIRLRWRARWNISASRATC